MRSFLLASILLGCPAPSTDTETDAVTDTAVECIATFGDRCNGCLHLCLTPEELEEIFSGYVCDLGCGEVTWECTVRDGRCEVE